MQWQPGGHKKATWADGEDGDVGTESRAWSAGLAWTASGDAIHGVIVAARTVSSRQLQTW